MDLSHETNLIFDKFKTSLSSERGKKNYYYTLNQFCNFCEKDFSKATDIDFNKYLAMLDKESKAGRLSYKTLCFKYSVLTVFSSYIINNEKTLGIKLKSHYMLSVPKPQVRIVVGKEQLPSLEQLDAIYESAKREPMLYAIIALVNKCALTTKQIIDLKKENFILDAEEQTGLLFPYKRAKNKYLKLPEDVLEVLNRWMKIRTDDSDYMFVNKRGDNLTSRSLQLKIKSLMERTFGKDEANHFTLQSLRNLSAVLMLKNGADRGDVAEYLGIRPNWIQRYDRAVAEYNEAPCDYINIKILTPAERRA